MSTSAAKLEKEEVLQRDAYVYLEDKAFDLLVGKDEPAKTGEIVRSVGIEGVTMRLIRDALGQSPKFETTDRRWTLAMRYDSRRPLDSVVEEIMKSYGRPILISDLAGELAHVFDRPREHYEELLPRLLSSQDKYFQADEGKWGLSIWLVLPYDNEEDVIFENFLSEAQIAQYERHGKKVSWDMAAPAGGALQLVAAAGEPVPLKVIEFYAWRALESDFDPIDFYRGMLASEDLLLLSNLTVADASIKEEFEKRLKAAAEELEKAGPEAGAEGVEAGGPVEVTESDVAEAVKMIVAGPDTVTADDILEAVLEVSPGEAAYDSAFDNLVAALKENPEVQEVGIGRWRPAESIPDHVHEIPSDLLIPPSAPFETPEGEVYDQELEDDGLESTLRAEMMNPLVQDVGDENPEASEVQPLGDTQRCVVKYHHKAAGTFPLCQINPAFLGSAPEVIQITLTGDGVRRDAWASNSNRLIYDMAEWYAGIEDMPLSGAVFSLERTSRPGEFRFVYHPEPDPLVHVPVNRIMELLELRNEADSTEMAVFDIVTRIMEQHKKGIGFIALFTEVNLVRRVSRRLVASILSSYHAFDQVKKTAEWRYDAKKRTQGFNKAKRKYIRK